MVIGAHADYTASITGGGGQNEISVFDLERDALKSFVKKMDSGANDRVAVFVYYENMLDQMVPFGTNMNLCQDTIERYVVKEKGAKRGLDGSPMAPKLYRFLREIVEDHMFNADLPRRKMVVVISDGRDTNAERPKKVQRRINDIVDPAKINQIKVYTIGFTLDTPKYLSDFARLAAGSRGVHRTISLDDVGETPDIASVFEEVGDELKRQLVVRFTPDDIEDGAFYKFKVKLKSPSAASEYAREVPVPERPTNVGGILLIVALVLGGIVFLIVLVKVIGGIMRGRAERVDEEPEAYAGPSKGRLAVTDGPYIGEIFYLTDEVTRIGSIAGNDIQIEDSSVSKRHCAIRVDEAALRYELADLGSTNGTFVNERKSGKCFLKDGDEIRVGTTKMVFHLK